MSRARGWRSAVSAAYLLTLVSDALPATPEAIRGEYARLQNALAHDQDGRPRDWSSADAARLIEAAWRLVGGRAVAHVAAHPDTSARDLVAAVAELNPPDAPAEEWELMDSYLEKNPYPTSRRPRPSVSGRRACRISASDLEKSLFFRVDRRGEPRITEVHGFSVPCP